MSIPTLRRWPLVVTLVLTLLLGACGGVGEMVAGERGSDEQNESSEADSGSGTVSGDGGSGDGNLGDPASFRLGVAGWENTCTVLSTDQVATATGFIVLEAREVGGCSWIVETVDENIVVGAESSIGWAPVRSRDFDIQQETAPLMSSDTVLEPLTGIGKQAFWLGNTVNSLGAVWVQTDEIGFSVINQFASGGYQGDSRQPMEALAAAIADSLEGIDVIAASGDAGRALIPPDRVDLSEGITTMDGLIPELGSVPLPAGAVFGSGDVYPDRASQDIYVDLGVGDTARFFLEALPGAGFQITSGGTFETADQVLEYAAQSVAFTDPEGRRGDIQIREGAFSPTQLGIQIFLSN